jgi:hypothetical protein
LDAGVAFLAVRFLAAGEAALLAGELAFLAGFFAAFAAFAPFAAFLGVPDGGVASGGVTTAS